MGKNCIVAAFIPARIELKKGMALDAGDHASEFAV
jgi:hypothetical protein